MKENTYIEYISSETIMAEFKNQLRTYFDSNILDESLFWGVFEECLSHFGTKYNPDDKTVLKIENQMADLPSDFKRLVLALGCSGGTVTLPDNRSVSTEEIEVCELDLCKTECDVCTNDVGQMYQIVQKTPTMRITWDKFEVLKIEDDPSICLEGCLNYQSSSTEYIKISNGKIHSNFNGLLYLEYIRELKKGDEILFPKHELIVVWIMDKLLEAAFKYLYFNGIGDVKTRWEDSKREVYISEENAKAFIKRNEVYNFYNLANALVSRYNRLARTVWNEEDYPGHYGI